MSWEVLNAAGQAVNSHMDMSREAMRDSLGHALDVLRSSTHLPEGKPNIGRFTGLPPESFQFELYQRNEQWHFTDRTLCILWCVEHPKNKDYTEDPDRFISPTRTRLNTKFKPTPPFVEYNQHGAPGRGPRRKGSSNVMTPIVSSDAKGPLWDAFVAWAQRFYALPNFRAAEREYKLKSGMRVAEARAALNAVNDDWLKRLRSAFTSNDGLTHYLTHGKWLTWWETEPEAAAAMLKDLWNPGSKVEDALDAFAAHLPPQLKSGPGTRLSIASFLLLGIDAPQLPPYQMTPFRKGYELTGYDRPASDSSDGDIYGHAIAFLDRLRQEASARGLDLADRLDAQGVLWAVIRWDPPADWSQEDRDALVAYRGGIIVTPTEPLKVLADELLVEASFLHDTKALLEDKRQMVFYGPPGTGKTYIAQRLAGVLVEDENLVEIVQFHPSYTYEDFVEGFRPVRDANGHVAFELREGPLKRMARAASENRGVPHILIIDELNRGNIAKVFGELYFLLEYRDQEITLQYSNERFLLPQNLWIIGTMNTADRSIALVDAALRRRFYFQAFFPDAAPIKGLLDRWLRKHQPGMLWVAGVVDAANARLQDRNAAIGPSHFLRKDLSEQWVRRIWDHAVLPSIEEHYFGEPDQLKQFSLDALRGFPVMAVVEPEEARA